MFSNFQAKMVLIPAFLTLLLIFIIIVDSVGRFLFLKPLLGAVEISRIILAYIIFLPFAYAMVQNKHIQLTILYDLFSPKLQYVVKAFILCSSLFFFSLFFYAGWIQFYESFMASEKMAAPIWIPFWLAKLAIPISGALMVIQLIFNIILHFRQKEK